MGGLVFYHVIENYVRLIISAFLSVTLTIKED